MSASGLLSPVFHTLLSQYLPATINASSAKFSGNVEVGSLSVSGGTTIDATSANFNSDVDVVGYVNASSANFSGNVEAGSLDVLGGLFMNGSSGTVGQYLTSQAGVTPIWTTPAVPPVYQGTYSKSTPQLLTSGSTDITFDLEGVWNNTNGYITHVSGTKDFTVVQSGLYQLEFNVFVVANGAVYLLTTVGKVVAIDITRSTEQSVISNTALQASAQNYSMSVTGTYYLEAGDIINLRVGNQFTGGPPSVQQALNTFDLNTYFNWRFIIKP